jgi:hypothetical protein
MSFGLNAKPTASTRTSAAGTSSDGAAEAAALAPAMPARAGDALACRSPLRRRDDPGVDRDGDRDDEPSDRDRAGRHVRRGPAVEVAGPVGLHGRCVLTASVAQPADEGAGEHDDAGHQECAAEHQPEEEHGRGRGDSSAGRGAGMWTPGGGPAWTTAGSVSIGPSTCS